MNKFQEEIFCSFILNENEFAVPVNKVQEVVNFPTKLTSIPLSPDYLMGLFNLRGTIIPLVNLRKVLGFKEKEVENEVLLEHKVAILELNQVFVGVLFDRTADVFKERSVEKSTFESPDNYNESDETKKKLNVVSGAFKMDSGQRIVQILEVSRLFSLQRVPKDISGYRAARGLGFQKRGLRQQCISFQIGPSHCALPISAIQEIIRVEKIQTSALGGGFCLGTIDLRGVTVPVIDFLSLLEISQSQNSKISNLSEYRIIIMKIEEEFFGLLVESVKNILSYYKDELLEFPLLEQKRSNMFLGCISGKGDEDILLLDSQNILSNSEILEITKGHSELYKSKSQEKNSHLGDPNLQKVAYLTFSIEGLCAISIKDVSEIIPCPTDFIKIPKMRKYVAGIINLRGELVTVIDTLQFFGVSCSNQNHLEKRIIIFKRNGMAFGLIVGSIDSIIHFSESEKLKFPKVSVQSEGGSIEGVFTELVRVPVGDGQKQDLMILNAHQLIDTVIKEPELSAS